MFFFASLQEDQHSKVEYKRSVTNANNSMPKNQLKPKTESSQTKNYKLRKDQHHLGSQTENCRFQGGKP